MSAPSPTTDVHDETGYDCWCSPRYLLACDAPLEPREISRAECDAADLPIVVVHNR